MKLFLICIGLFALFLILAPCQGHRGKTHSSGDNGESLSYIYRPGKCRRDLVIQRCRGRRGPPRQGFYYDRRRSQCRPYYYKCGKPQFAYIKDCITTCHPRVKSEMPLSCYREVHRVSCRRKSYYAQKYYTYHAMEGKCMMFYTRCQLPIVAYSNIYKKLEDCRAMCHDKTRDDSSGERDICKLKKDHGRGGERIERFYFDNDCGDCRPFTYRGCAGNKNNFESLKDCRKRCKPKEKCETSDEKPTEENSSSMGATPPPRFQ